MKPYLNYAFRDTPEFVSTFDEMPLWSAAFGLMLLKHLEYKRGLTILDIGSGAGFPLMEIAARFGSTCKCYGLDVWANANNRARQKIGNYRLTNVEVIDASAEVIPFDDNSIDLVVSNLGINNFDKPSVVFKECFRVLRPGGKLALTTNLNGHWRSFYDVFETTLLQLDRPDLVETLTKDQEHRGTKESVAGLFETAELNVSRTYEDTLEMKFTDGSAFLNHYFIKLGWLSTWLGLFKNEDLEWIFGALEDNLNEHAASANGLNLTVPMLFMEGVKA